MTFLEAIQSGFRNYFNFSGRASRSEYWFWVLFTILAGIATSIVDLFVLGTETFNPLNTLFNLAVLIPSFAIGVRRLHDIDRTGWWLLIAFTIIGAIVLIVWFCQKSDPGTNRFGVPPLQPMTGTAGVIPPAAT